MSLHPDDLRRFATGSGQQQFPPQFVEEYDHWLRLYHRMGYSGPLGMLMVPLMRVFGVEPPADAPRDGSQINWRTTPIGTRVMVKTESGGILRGTYQGLGSQSMVIVLPMGTNRREEFPPIRVLIDDSPQSFEQPSQPAIKQIPDMPPLDSRPAPASLAAPTVRTFAEVGEGGVLGSQNDLPPASSAAAPTRLPVKMGAPWWGQMKPGKKIRVITDDNDIVDATFVGVGPSDNQFKAIPVGGELAELYEESKYIPSNYKKTFKKPAGKKKPAKKAAAKKAAPLAEPAPV